MEEDIYKKKWREYEDDLNKTYDHIQEVLDEEYKLISGVTKNIEVETALLPNLSEEDRMPTKEIIDNFLFSKKIRDRKIAKLLRLKERPYFMKINFQKQHEGHYFISENEGFVDANIISFTAPLAEHLRYANPGDYIKDYNIKSKGIVDIEARSLKSINYQDLNNSFEFNGIDVVLNRGVSDIKVELSAEGNFTHLEKSNYNQIAGIKPIASLLRKEQDEAMRLTHEGVTLITGPAGSGKTDVGFHRLLFLEREKGIKSEDVGVFCFNVSLKNYLQKLTSKLGLKCSIESIDQWLSLYLRTFSNFEGVDYDNTSAFLISDKHSFEEAYASITKKFNQRCRDLFVEKEWNCSDLLNDSISLSLKYINELRIKIVNQNVVSEKINDALKSILKDMFFTEFVWKWDFPKTGSNIKSFRIDVKKVFNLIGVHKNTNTLSKQERDFLALFLTHLLDGLLSLEGSVPTLMKIKGNTELLYSDNKINKKEIYKYLDYRNNYSAGLKEFERLNYLLKYKHILLDEVQDIPPLQLMFFNSLHQNSMTMIGDFTQKIFSTGINSVDDIGINIVAKKELAICHRITLETALFANEIINQDISENKINVNYVTKRGEAVQVVFANSEDNRASYIAKTLENILKDNPNASVAICCSSNNDAQQIFSVLNKKGLVGYVAKGNNWDFSKNIHISTYHQVKGLEFDHVILLDADKFFVDNPVFTKKALFTAITRAQKSVFCFVNNLLPEYINEATYKLFKLTDEWFQTTEGG